ncbi:hypothetical protein Pint_05590 [Pistacia integerrima]|uniref:Uncharacterized protein n=1 Tax=Pistacia integerrima TaxID=434235 RepID=A0ACC0Z6Y3_9ROSI|nr:hypothetical protein Pint_05590 [Pistacia integerrima]
MLGQTDQDRRLPSVQLFLMYLMYRLIGLYCHSNYNPCDHTEATSNVAMFLHLQVWGLFAPKFVFDVVGFILTDDLICLACLYYFGFRGEVDDANL